MALDHAIRVPTDLRVYTRRLRKQFRTDVVRSGKARRILRGESSSERRDWQVEWEKRPGNRTGITRMRRYREEARGSEAHARFGASQQGHQARGVSVPDRKFGDALVR